MITTELEDPVTTRPAEAEGVLTDEILKSLRNGYQMNVADRACHNAVTNNDTKSLALNRSAIRGDDGHFTHRIGIKGVTNQKKSGRCWIFAGLNVLRPRMLRDLRMEEFEFSTAYLQFWDKMEKSNLYLESIIELRDVDFLDRDWETVNKWTFEDGGWWSYLVGLVGKYGVMPLSAMPQTHASNNTETLNEVLGRLLRARAAAMMHKYSAGADVDELRSDKTKVLAEVYRLLVIHFGEPPLEFEWRYPVRNTREKDGEADLNPDCSENRSLTTPERHTPQSFYQKYVSRPLGEFVCLYNDPHCEFNRHYRFDRARNIVGNECMDFVNIDSARMKELDDPRVSGHGGAVESRPAVAIPRI
jgi:bleomycin hydrolase